MRFKDQSTGVGTVQGDLLVTHNNSPINKVSSAVTELILALSENTEKEKILRHLKNQYMDSVDDLCKEKDCTGQAQRLELIKKHSDDIIDSVIQKLHHEVSNSANIKKLQIEDITHGIRYIVFHAFVECKILEKPSK